MFKFIIALFGISVVWKKKNENFFLISIFLFIIFSVILYEKSNIIYASFFLSYLAALGFHFFLSKKWEIEMLKTLTLITIFSGLLFSSVSYSSVLVDSNYSFEQSESLIWLKENNEKGLILSHYSYGYFINYHSNMPVFMDSYFKNNQKINDFYSLSENIFFGYNLQSTSENLDSLNIRYIWIDKNMKEDLVWDDTTGLLFLLRNKDVFNLIYSKNNIEIYEFLGKYEPIVY
jgi:hypothetical protein